MAEEIEQLKVGDVVQLKSGGPRMTVAEAQEGKQICCLWYSEQAAQFAEPQWFPARLLRKVNPPLKPAQ